ncbi:interferon-induced, double-stranded RNA-activated protein kinase-like [Rana temporaria]|uniref:interferon-induced, double-stranded RNA-activated protein kinase-like n=1 Tax=Rana temporaria TaxID=8407 RepID=UPI001AAE15F0|nr:interferon-induced, double-stranded RNA-activated protein kinase-like [Rana temporaria]XP_040206721.1 interferon-induced, double-stranded RNA-activated protein kinase-like [Rana temporaria]
MAKINYKGLLLNFCLTNKSTPMFLCEPTGPSHDRRFICKVFIDDTLLGEAEGKQKKEAENKAAKKALESLGYEGAEFQPDFISLLSQFCQKKGWTFNFVKAARIGPSHDPEFACSVEANKTIFPQSSRKKNKKLSEKEAAYLALKELKKDFPDDIQELPEFFKDESKSENWSCSGSTSDASLDASTGENGLARLTTSDSSLDRSTAECGLQQSTAASEHQQNYTVLFCEFCQKKKLSYNFVDTPLGGPSHMPQFSCRAEIDGKKYPETKPHASKKLAKKEAAFLALMELKKEFPQDFPVISSDFIPGFPSARPSILSTNDVSLDRGTSESGQAQLTADYSSLDRSTTENGLQQSTAASEHQRDYNAALHEICQKKKIILNFVDTHLGGPSHQPQFSCRAEIDGKKYPESKPHATKKLAKKEAGFLAWMELNKELPRDNAEIPSGFIPGSQSASSSILSPRDRTSAESGIAGVATSSFEVTFHSSCPTPSNPERKSAKSGQDRLSRADSEMSSQSTSSSFSSGSNTYQNPLKDFKDITKLASGSFGRVFKARKILDDMDYAVKEIPVRPKRKGHLDEVKALARLEHPNIVRYFNAWWADSPVYISDGSENSSSSSDLKQAELYLFIQMELCVKGSLKQWIKERNSKKTVDKSRSLQFFKQIIEAIKYIHSQKLIHRDLKPANIFCNKAMIIKIGDFGLVTQMTGEDESKARQRTQGTGTPSYMAPEQRDGNKYENEVDIYALGLIFFELLWIFDSVHERASKWIKIRKGDFPMEFSKRHPVEVYEIKRMLSEDPEKRPSAEELHNIFETNEILDSKTQ